MNLFNSFKGMDAASQYAAPMSYELCGKTLGVLWGGAEAKPARFAPYPGKTVQIGETEYPYFAAKAANNIVFVVIQSGDEVVASAFDVENNAAQCYFLNIKTGEGGFDAIATASGGTLFAEDEEACDFSGNTVAWTVGSETSFTIEYDKKALNLSAPNGMPMSLNFSGLQTKKLAEGVYMQVITLDAFRSKAGLCAVMNFNKVTITGVFFASMPQRTLCREIGGFGKILNAQ